ncbi:hypothetical protein MKEN_00822800 [Mycena kentingensis (nom. inval.)]|nr:hypothetical protein MKEN_00822800 [Mycena kentingensis (nom. inval.)]
MNKAPTRLVASSVWSLVRPTLPYTIPILVCLACVPAILFLSASAGFVVWRAAAVSWSTPLYLQYGDGPPPYARTTLPPLVAKQRYDISLDLQVPNIDTNLALGNFMAGLTLYTRANKTLTSVRRPAIVVPPAPRFLFAQSSIREQVEIGRRDHWTSLGKGRELSVVSATLSGVVVHHGVRGLVTRFPLLSGLVAAGIFMVISSLIVGICILPLMFRHPIALPTTDPDLKLEPEAAFSSDISDSSDTSEEKLSVLRRKISSLQDIKAEDDAIPDATKATTLRRRRSKLVDPVSSESDS